MSNRLDRITMLLEEISTKYPQDLSEVEDYLIDLISYYSDREDYVSPEEIEVKPMKCIIQATPVRPSIILESIFDHE